MGLAPQDWWASLEPDCRSPRELTLAEVAWAAAQAALNPPHTWTSVLSSRRQAPAGLVQSPREPSDPRAITAHSVQCSQTCPGYSAQVWDADSGVRTGHLSKVTQLTLPSKGWQPNCPGKEDFAFFFLSGKTPVICICVFQKSFTLFGSGLECSRGGSVSPDLPPPQPMSLFMSFPFAHLNYPCCCFLLNLLWIRESNSFLRKK